MAYDPVRDLDPAYLEATRTWGRGDYEGGYALARALLDHPDCSRRIRHGGYMNLVAITQHVTRFGYPRPLLKKAQES